MLGWDVSVHRPTDALTGPDDPRVVNAPSLAAVTLASWSARIGGLMWLDTLCETGQASHVLKGGYPMAYLARASDVLPVLEDPPARKSADRTNIDLTAASSTRSDEWLVVIAWDQS